MTNEEQHILNTAEHQAIGDTLNRIDKKLERVDLTLHGNGKEGLVTTVSKHTQTLTVLKRIFWGIASVLGTIVGALAVAALL